MKREGRGIGFWGRSYVLMRPYLRPFERYFKDMALDLSRGGFRIAYRAYVAGMVFASAISVVIGAVVGLLLAVYLRALVTFRVLMPLGFALFAGALTFAVFYIRPHFRASSRGSRLNSELPYAVGHMAVLASAGMTPEKMFHALAEEESKDAVNQEAKTIVRDMSLLGMDLRHALQAAEKRSPSDRWAEFLDGFVAASGTGRDLKSYLLRSGSSTLLEKRLRARSVSDSVGLVAEMYTITLVVMPLLLLIMFAVIGIISGSIGGFSVVTLIYIITFVVVPLGGVAVLIVADSTIGKEAT